MNELEIIKRLIGAVDKAKPRLSRQEWTAVREARAFVADAEKSKPKSKKKAPRKKKVEAEVEE